MTDTLIIMVIPFEKNKLEHLFRLVVVGYPFLFQGMSIYYVFYILKQIGREITDKDLFWGGLAHSHTTKGSNTITVGLTYFNPTK